MALAIRQCRDIVAETLVAPLSDVQALVLDPLAAVAVRVLETEVVVVAELLREDVICDNMLALILLKNTFRIEFSWEHIPSSTQTGRL